MMKHQGRHDIIGEDAAGELVGLVMGEGTGAERGPSSSTRCPFRVTVPLG